MEVNVRPKEGQEAPPSREFLAAGEVHPRFVSYRQAETFAGLSRTTLWSLIKRGEIEAARCGRAVRIDLESLTAYMKRSAEKSSVGTK